ncbi:thioredoxin domain-containing protein 3 homolog isoform X2 [Octopus sinensis]|uniref:Thioredoxin domain-containing protein 3 homolog isoform X2 n=1 Tax=Octopus sinensis TaxID=2607531 RepID=A0A6P7U9C6_9MOLL|nr:thioredoxin domain-containing protein 3 homolog isoform X2 [Octopus sinensis]
MESPTLSEENVRSPTKSSMARRKAEIILQRELETQEDWEDFLSKEGLLVIDVYQEWAGPCSSLVSNFKKLRNELSDDLLRYAVAKADRIESLVLYRGKCKPCFLFFAGGVLVNVIRGAQYPLIKHTIITELAQEHKVLNGEARRVKIIDKELPFIKESSESEEEAETEALLEEVTVAIIKPDAVQDGRVETILEMMEAEGIEIVANEKKLLTDKIARAFYHHLSEEPFYEDYIQFMTSGPCHILVLKKKNKEKGIVCEWKQKLGPLTVEDAKESAPDSWRAKFGSSGYMNALHGSDSQPSAMRELGFFFPRLSRTLPHRRSKTIERTLAIIRPDAYTLYKDEIIAKIHEAGFNIALQKEFTLCRSDIEEFYSHVVEEDYFEDLVEEMTSGPLLALGLARENAVVKWKEILGPPDKSDAFETAPHCLRAQFMVPETDVNLLHGSDSVAEAEKELSFFFPHEETVAVIKPEAFDTKEDIMAKIEEAGFKISARKEMVLTEDIINKMYKKDQSYYEDLKRYLMTGPSMFMVLTREDAVFGFRQLLGPVDPIEAKKIDPYLLRAQFGTDIMQNALHGTSSLMKAQQLKNMVFGTDTSRDQSLDASREMSPNILTSSESPLSIEYIMAREAAEDDTKPLQSVVNIISESSIEDVLEVESSVEIVGAKSSSVKEQHAISTPPQERLQSEGIEEKDVTAEEITQEAQDEVSKPPEAAEETEKPPEAAEETEKPPEAAEETEKPPEAAEAEKPPEAAEEAEKPPEAAEEAEKPPEAAEAEKPPEAAEETGKPPEAAEAEKPPEAAEEAEKPPEAAEEAEKPPEAAEEAEKPPEAAEAEKPPEAAEETVKPPEAAEETEKPPEAAEAVKPPEAAEAEKPPEAAEAEKPPEAAEETGKPPEAAEAVKPPEAAEAEKPPEAAEEAVKPPEAAEETGKPPEAAEETEKPPEAAEETGKPPEAAEAVKPPEAAEAVKPPEAAEETVKPPEAAESPATVE